MRFSIKAKTKQAHRLHGLGLALGVGSLDLLRLPQLLGVLCARGLLLAWRALRLFNLFSLFSLFSLFFLGEKHLIKMRLI